MFVALYSYLHMSCVVALVDCTYAVSATGSFKNLLTVAQENSTNRTAAVWVEVLLLLRWTWWQFPGSKNYTTQSALLSMRLIIQYGHQLEIYNSMCERASLMASSLPTAFYCNQKYSSCYSALKHL